MQTLSLVFGILAILGLLIGVVPCLGSLNWLNIPFAIVGAVLGLLAYNSAGPTQPRGTAKTAVVLCALAAGLGLLRLILGGGIL